MDLYHTSSSVVADKFARRAVSRKTAKFKNSHVTITMPILLVIFCCWNWHCLFVYKIWRI